MIKYLLALNFFAVSFAVMSQTNQTNEKSPATMMREMRQYWLHVSAAEVKIEPSAAYPKVFAVIMDIPLGTNTFTVLGSLDGDASIYTTAGFGIIGGIGHEEVRSVAKDFVKTAQKYYQDANAATNHSYPKSGEVFFYLSGFEGLRVIRADEEGLKSEANPRFDLFSKGQKVITELRLIVSEKPNKETNIQAR